MNIANVITIVSLIICCNGCLSPAQILESTSASTDRMPKNWNLQEISAGALDPGGDEAIINSDILCWQVKEDGRPLRVEYCILWLHLKEKNKSIWRVIHMVRSPSRLNRWEPACVDGGWWDYLEQ